MKFMHQAAIASLILLSACGPKAVKTIQPVSASLHNASSIADVQVTLSPLAQTVMDKFEAKAAEKRVEAGLAPVDATAAAAEATRDQYATLPFAQMFELVVKDVAREQGLVSGRPLKVAVEIDTLKTANAGMAMLAGSSDQLAGQVNLLDAQSGEKLGAFYVDVINSHAGLLGLAMRGGGIREKLSQEFAVHIADQLKGKGK